MANLIRIIAAIATLLTFLACFAGAVWAVFFSSIATEPKILTTVVCLSLCGLMSFFLLSDYRKFFGNKNEPTK